MERISWPKFIFGVAWCAFLFGTILSDVGETTAMTTITWWDAVWVTFVGAVFPFALGIMAIKQ